jgi:large subunit ribosomal protein L19
VFPLHSPKIAHVKVQRRGEVRRAKLYYLRQRVGKGTRLREVMGFETEAQETAAPGEPKAAPAPKKDRAAAAK